MADVLPSSSTRARAEDFTRGRQRRAERSPSVSLAVNRTPPQWQAPLIGFMAAFIHGSLFGIRINDYTLSAPRARRMRASALLAANDRFRETRTGAMSRGCVKTQITRRLDSVARDSRHETRVESGLRAQK
jgi:hypothetical protein